MNLAIMERNKRYVIYVLITIVLMILLYFVLTKPKVTMRMIYTVGQNAQMTNTLAYDMGEGYRDTDIVSGSMDAKGTSQRRFFELFFDIPASYENPSGIKIILQPDVTENPRIQIKALEIYNHNISVAKYSPKELQNLFFFEQVKKAYIEGDRLCIEAAGKEPSLVAKEPFVKAYSDCFRENKGLIWNLLFTGVLLAAIAMTLDTIVSKYMRIDSKDRVSGMIQRSQLCMRIMMLIALICVAIMAIKSQNYAHPDEDVTRLAIDYYMGKWLPPDVRSTAVLGTFSNYGFTRLGELTLYYLLSGKIGWICVTIFHICRYYRLFNVLLFTIMVGMFALKGKKHLWMFLALGITPQLWYLFSYATSDAFDYFCSFLVIFELVEEDSMLNRLLMKCCKKPMLNLLVIGLLFSMIIRGKANYYLILLFAFCVLLKKWIQEKREKKATLLLSYIAILVCSFLLLGARIAVNYGYYGSYTANGAAAQLVEEKATGAYKPSAIEETGSGYSRASKGYSYANVMIKDSKRIITGLISSGVGSYGWLEYYHRGIYGYFIVSLYGVLSLYIVYYMIKERKVSGIIDAIILMGLPILIYLMVVYQCWSGDFQTQGRYALPLLLVVAYYSSQCKELYQVKMYNLLLVILGLFSLYSYIFMGIGNLVIKGV